MKISASIKNIKKRQIFSKEKNKKIINDDSYEEFKKEFEKLKIKKERKKV